jgi:hypothetical protein
MEQLERIIEEKRKLFIYDNLKFKLCCSNVG